MSDQNLPQVIESGNTNVLDLSVNRDPSVVLQEAQRAATALKDVISKKHKPVVFNGEQYLEFEDWQTVGRFYGVCAKVIETRLIEIGSVIGFEARAVAIKASTGEEISAADAMCLNDEKNWASKPLFQLRSMAQTRACGKALRNVLAWVVVLAGYRPTPAEEMESSENSTSNPPAAHPPEQAANGNGNGHGVPSDHLLMVDAVTVKEGKNDKGPWKKYSIRSGKDYYSTFSESFGNEAIRAKDMRLPVMIEWKADDSGQYKNVTNLEVQEKR